MTVGPRDGHDAIGADLYAAISARLAWVPPIELFRQSGTQCHLFANAGNSVVLPGDSLPNTSSLRSLQGSVRVGYGGGVAIPTPIGRLELNITRQMGEPRFQPQVGLGVSFL